MMVDPNCIFCGIAQGNVPTHKPYDDGTVFAIADLNPVTPTHMLIIPYEHVGSLADERTENVSAAVSCFAAAPVVAKVAGVADSGYRLVANQGTDAGQEIAHFHLHLLAGRALGGMG